MALDIREVGPPALRAAIRDALLPYSRFRHLFRNLYAFGLQANALPALLRDVVPTTSLVRHDLEAFVAFLEGVGTRS